VLADALPLLISALPDADAVIGRFDWDAKRAVLGADMERTRVQEAIRLAKPRHHNKACRAILRMGAVCPFCRDSSRIEFVDQAPQGKSFFECGACGRTFGPVEVIVHRLYGELQSFYEVRGQTISPADTGSSSDLG
jgi:hypothetical protein